MIATLSLFAAALGRIESPSDAPKPNDAKWKEMDRAARSEKVEMLMVLKRDPKALEKLEKLFWEVSDPKHENYGAHLTQDEVTALIGVTEEQLKAVTDYLEKHNAEIDVGVHRDLLKVTMDVATTEAMFDVTMNRYQHQDTSASLIRTKVTPSLPSELQNHISVVDNLDGFPVIDKPIVIEIPTNVEYNSFPSEYSCGGHCPNLVTPGVLTERYKLGTPTNSQQARSTMAVSEFQGVYWSQKQLNNFNNYCKVNSTIDVQRGYNNQNRCDGYEGQMCTEALLDIEYLRAVAGDIPTTNFFSSQYSLLNWAKAIEDLPDSEIPMVNSVSYGNDEAQQSSQQYMEECNVEFQKLGVRGVSVLFASGDQGVWGREGVGRKYHPDFPGGSPYITVVGGTDFAESGVIGDEKAWNDGGGGFSDTFTIPSYQADAVAQYKKTASLPRQRYWNNNGRGYPDVAALGGVQNAYCVAVENRFAGVGGTSAACPVFAGVIAKLNEVRLAKGGKPLGFLNPWLYQNADMFNDVTLGRNGGAISSSGFPAVKGWDAATGLGTPNFELMKTRV